MAAPKKVDYARIEPGWRAGILSVAQLAEAYTAETGVKCSPAAVHKYFVGLGTPRNLGAKIAAKAEAIVRESVAGGKVDAQGRHINLGGELPPPKEAEIVKANATAIADVLLGQRKLIQRQMGLVLKLMEECEIEAGDIDTFRQIGEILYSKDESKLSIAYQKAISLPARIKGVKDLAETLRTLVSLQRESFGMASGQEGGVDDAPPNKIENPAAYYAWFAAQGAKR